MSGASPNNPAAFVAAALASKPDLIVHGADRPETVRAVLKVLAQGGNLFDRGGVLVKLVRPSDGGPPIARQLTYNNVIVETHRSCQPVELAADGTEVAITLPDAVARMLLDLGEWGLPALAGVTTAPLLAADGSILVSAGYDSAHAMWCEPVPDLTVPDRPTRAQADASLLILRNAFCTFPFAGSPMVERGATMVVDTSKPPSAAESAFLAALQTACCRPSLWLAPGVLIVAPEVSGAGSGKGLLVRAICLIAFGCPPSAFTPGHDRQELDKRLVAALIEAAPAVFLDNLNSVALLVQHVGECADGAACLRTRHAAFGDGPAELRRLHRADRQRIVCIGGPRAPVSGGSSGSPMRGSGGAAVSQGVPGRHPRASEGVAGSGADNLALGASECRGSYPWTAAWQLRDLGRMGARSTADARMPGPCGARPRGEGQ